MRATKLLIIGICAMTLALTGAPSALAIYSPTIAAKAGQIKQHILISRQVNGSGDLLSITATVQANNRARRELGEPTGVSGHVSRATNTVLQDLMREIILAPIDSLTMIFQYVFSTQEAISTCLRDDIWLLEDLKGIVIEEMIKSYMLGDVRNGHILSDDYRWLMDHVEILKDKGDKPDETVTVNVMVDGSPEATTLNINQYLFGNSAGPNYYIDKWPEEGGCPENDWQVLVEQTTGSDPLNQPEGQLKSVFQQVENTWNMFTSIENGSPSDWQSIWEAAYSRARRRAADWIKSNQITFTLGGGGTDRTSLIKSGGFDRIAGSVKTQLRILEDVVIGPVTPLFSPNLWGTIGEVALVATGISDEERLANNQADGPGLGSFSPFNGTTSQVVDGQVLYETSDGNCVYYYPDRQEFLSCTQEQRDNFVTCESGTDAEKAAVNCDRFQNPNTVKGVYQHFSDLGERAERNGLQKFQAKTAFKYHLSLNNIGETNIYAMEEQLFLLNGEVRRGIEAVDKGAGEGLPTVYANLEAFEQRHCPNKQR